MTVELMYLYFSEKYTIQKNVLYALKNQPNIEKW